MLGLKGEYWEGKGFKGRAKDSHYLSKDFKGLFVWSSRTGLLEFQRKTAEQASWKSEQLPQGEREREGESRSI